MYKHSKFSATFIYVCAADGGCLQCFDAVGWAAGRAPGL